MPKASPGLEQQLPDYLYARLLRRAFPYHPVSQNEPLVKQLDDGERSPLDFALALARLQRRDSLRAQYGYGSKK